MLQVWAIDRVLNRRAISLPEYFQAGSMEHRSCRYSFKVTNDIDVKKGRDKWIQADLTG